jgi:RNA polymerase sigma-70 factor (ECF subfamily)
MLGAAHAVQMPTMMTPAARGSADDARVARACAAGDSGAFEELYRVHGARMKSLAYNHVGNIADAEDAVQETFIKIHRAAQTYNGGSAFSTWIYRILINTCYDLIRKRRRRGDESSIDETFERSRAGAAVDDAKRITLRKLLDQLPEQRRSVFVLFEIEGLSHAEIGEILDISEGNSKWILFATKKQLQEKWRQ